MNQPMNVPFALIPQALAQDATVSDSAFRMYAIIASWTPNKKDGLRYIHCSELAAALDIKSRQVKYLTAQLCAAGWLLKSGDGGCNRPARYQPLQGKTMHSDCTVLGDNHALRLHGQSVDTLSLYKPRVDEVDSDARAKAADASTSGDKYRFPLPQDFRPPQSWIDAAQQARSEAGKPPLSPPQIDALITKFVGAKTQRVKPMDQARWKMAFIEWFVRENHRPKKTLGNESVRPQPATPPQTAVEPQPAAEMPKATPQPPPPSSVAENADTALETANVHKTLLLELAKGIGGKMAMPMDRGYEPLNPGASVPNPPDAAKIWIPKNRAKFAAAAAAQGIPLPKNCTV